MLPRPLFHRILALFLTLLILAGCGSGSSSNSATTPAATAAVAGVVVAASSGAPLAGVKVSSGTLSTTTAADGTFTLQGLPGGSTQVLTYTQSGYSLGLRTVVLNAALNRADSRLTPVGVTQTVNSGTAVTVSDTVSPAQVQLPGSYVTSAGTAYSGAVTVTLTRIDPSANPANMAGGYQVANAAAAASSTLESYGALEVTLKDGSGNRLNLASGQTATIRIPLAAARTTVGANPPATIPLFYLDETTGLWVQQGTATLAGPAGGQYYQGSVSHFSLWNADQVLNSISVCGVVKDAGGKAVAGADVTAYGVDYTGESFATSAADGTFCVRIKINARANLQATTTAPDLVSQVETVGPSAVDFTAPAPLVLGAQPSAPVIVAPPANDAPNIGTFELLSVTAIGSPVLTYQWYLNGTAIPGATASSFYFLVTDNSVAGTYTVKVSNAYGSTTSTTGGVITVNPTLLPPLIVFGPQTVQAIIGATATFQVYAYSQGGAISYQWQVNGANIAGATSLNYTTPTLAGTDNGSAYRVVVTSTLGALTSSVTSTAATLSVAAAAPVTISSPPQSVTVSVGQTATFSVSASAGGSALTFQWLRNGNPISGATGSSYTTPATQATDNGSTYTVQVTSAAGPSATSAAATLTVTTAPTPLTISSQPNNATVAAGSSATFTVTPAGGSGTYAYQWLRNGSAISGATAASYTLAAASSADNGAAFSVTVTSGSSSVTSTAATLNVTAAVSSGTYYLTTLAGNTASSTATFANGAISSSSPALLAVPSTGTPAGALTVEAAGQASVPFADFYDGTVSGNTLNNPRQRLAVYLKGGAVRVLDQQVATGGTLASTQASSLSTSAICGDSSGTPLFTTGISSASDVANPAASWVFLVAPGADGQCSTADDTYYGVRPNMSASTAPVNLGSMLPVQSVNSATGALTGMVVLNGSQLQLLDSTLANPVSLYPVNAATFISHGLKLGSSAPGIWLFSEGTTLWAVNLATPGTRTALATLAATEHIANIVSDGTTAYAIIVGTSSTRIVQISAGLATSTLVTLNQTTFNSVSLSPSRIIYQDASQSVHAVTRVGGTDSVIYTPPSSGFASGGVQALLSGENVYLNVFSASNSGGNVVLSLQVVILNSDGSNVSTLSGSQIVGILLGANQNLANGFFNPYALLVVDGITAFPSESSSPLRAIEGATRNTLVNYGKVPAAPAGYVTLGTSVTVFGQGGLLLFQPTASTLAASGADVYFFNSGSPGLTLETAFNTITPAAQRAPTVLQQRPAVRASASTQAAAALPPNPLVLLRRRLRPGPFGIAMPSGY